MKFLSKNLMTLLILFFALSSTGCKNSALNEQPYVPSNDTAALMGIWHLISDNGIIDNEHSLAFNNGMLTEIVSKSEPDGDCVDAPQLYREFEWSETQHSNQLKLVTLQHVKCGSELSAGDEQIVSFRHENDVLYIFGKRWKRTILAVN